MCPVCLACPACCLCTCPPICHSFRMSCMFSIALFLVSKHGAAALPVIIPSRLVTLGAMRPNVGD